MGIINIVVEALAQQKYPSVEGGLACYLSSDGRMCAVGHLLNENQKKFMLENPELNYDCCISDAIADSDIGIEMMARFGVPKDDEDEFYRILEILQDAHDSGKGKIFEREPLMASIIESVENINIDLKSRPWALS